MQQMQNMQQYQMRGNFPQNPYMQQGYNGGPHPGGHGMMDDDGGGMYRNNGGRGGRGGGRGSGRRSGRRNSNRDGMPWSNSGRYINNGYNSMNNNVQHGGGADNGGDQQGADSNADAS